MQLEAVDLIHVRVPLRQPFRTARSVTTHKESLLMRFHTDEGVGWGECAAEIAPSYTAEFVDGAWLVLRDHLLPRLLSGPWSSYEELDERLADGAGSSDGQGGDRDRARSTRTSRDRKRAWRRISARRVRSCLSGSSSIWPIHWRTATTALSARRGGLPAYQDQDRCRVMTSRSCAPCAVAIGDAIDLWVDANGSYAADDPVLRELDELGLGLIEQPLSPDAWLEHGILARQFDTAICLDESISIRGRHAAGPPLRRGRRDQRQAQPRRWRSGRATDRERVR